jgi:hypothetical protein
MKRTHNCTPSADRKVISNGRNVVNYARIVTIARDRNRAKQTLTRLCEIAPNTAHRAYFANLSLTKGA